MDITIYTMFFMVALLMFLLSLVFNQDYDMKIVFSVIALVMFIVLALLSFNIERLYFDGTQVQSYQITDEVYVYFNFIMAIVAFMHGFVLIMNRATQHIYNASDTPGLLYNPGRLKRRT
jgi:hypothetical protein